jgi:hypothetical protein
VRALLFTIAIHQTLNNAHRTDYKLKLPNGSDAAVSVCGPLTGETWGLDEAKDLGGRVRRDHGDFSLGKYNETLLVKDGMPMLVYENGEHVQRHRPDVGPLTSRRVEVSYEGL